MQEESIKGRGMVRCNNKAISYVFPFSHLSLISKPLLIREETMETKLLSSSVLAIMATVIVIAAASTGAAVPTTRDIHIVRRGLLSDPHELCKTTTNPNLCVQTLTSHLKGPMDELQALSVEVDATLESAKKTLGDITSLFTKPETPKSMKNSLDICKDQYKSMLDAIAETKAAISKKDVVTAKFKFSAVISFQSACKDSFDAREKIPFSQDSDTVYQLGGNSLDIIADYEKQHPAKPAPVQQTPSAFSNVIGTVS
ncbi:hypothetical protein Fmac_009452 [Flemingia macrophylla]|uniref:Pectinesterase inhibitor domain-containing protein n=1 Tax=Flemingia macrophylla TaxID=520843 RepID=A0ABD1N0B1_9FABA